MACRWWTVLSVTLSLATGSAALVFAQSTEAETSPPAADSTSNAPEADAGERPDPTPDSATNVGSEGSTTQVERGAASESEPAQASTRKTKKKARPGGINPCMTPDPGFGIYDAWSRKITMGQLIAPVRGGVTKAGSFDLLIHFHGHEPARKEFVKAGNGIVFVGIDLGIGSGAYSSAFASSQVFERLLKSVEEEIARRHNLPRARIRHLGLSSWSAGYGAVQQILLQPAGAKVDSVLLLDSLHASYVGGGPEVAAGTLAPFIDFARQAARGKRFLFQSYSSIVPPGYASTREVAHHLIRTLRGSPKTSRRADALGLSMDERFDRGNYHVRGYLGDDKPDHCAHLGLLKDIVRVHLNRRWNPPRGRAAGRPSNTKQRSEKTNAKPPRGETAKRKDSKTATKRPKKLSANGGRSRGR